MTTGALRVKQNYLGKWKWIPFGPDDILYSYGVNWSVGTRNKKTNITIYPDINPEGNILEKEKKRQNNHLNLRLPESEYIWGNYFS